MNSGDEATDGRVARGERNRLAVIEAAIALTVETGTFPTAQMIAERAGVAARSVFHHFPDLDSLFAATADYQGEKHWTLLFPHDPDQSLERRIAQAVARRAELFEQISAVRRAATLHEHDWPAVAARLSDSRAGLRRHLRRALSPELASLDKSAIAALEAAASWETWEVLRRHQGLSVRAATAAVRLLLSSTLEQSMKASD